MVTKLVEFKVPANPPCWETCGNCATEDLVVDEILVGAGETVKFGQTVLILETNKTALEVPSLYDGRVVEMLVHVGDEVHVGDVLARIATE